MEEAYKIKNYYKRKTFEKYEKERQQIKVSRKKKHLKNIKKNEMKILKK